MWYIYRHGLQVKGKSSEEEGISQSDNITESIAI